MIITNKETSSDVVFHLLYYTLFLLIATYILEFNTQSIANQTHRKQKEKNMKNFLS